MTDIGMHECLGTRTLPGVTHQPMTLRVSLSP
jgi:hypothetical protein